MTEIWALAVFSVFATIVVGIQSWILIKLTNLDKQVYRLVSDRESEKGTIARVHADFEKRLRDLELHLRRNQ